MDRIGEEDRVERGVRVGEKIKAKGNEIEEQNGAEVRSLQFRPAIQLYLR
jgi:hypothetical protein